MWDFRCGKASQLPTPYAGNESKKAHMTSPSINERNQPDNILIRHGQILREQRDSPVHPVPVKFSVLKLCCEIFQNIFLEQDITNKILEHSTILHLLTFFLNQPYNMSRSRIRNTFCLYVVCSRVGHLQTDPMVGAGIKEFPSH